MVWKQQHSGTRLRANASEYCIADGQYNSRLALACEDYLNDFYKYV